MVKTIQQVAQDVCDQFEIINKNGKQTYHMKTPGDPVWIAEMIRDCHYDGMLPDDFTFENVYQFCKEIAQLDPNKDPREIEVCCDTYTGELLAWLSSNLARCDFVDQALADYYHPHDGTDFFTILGLAQEKELDNILFIVIDHLENRIDYENE